MFQWGRGWRVTWLALLAMVLPMVILRQMDGPAMDRGVALTMGLAAFVTLLPGLRRNRGGAPGQAARHSFRGLTLQLWAVPTLLLAVLLGFGTIATPEASGADRSDGRARRRDGGQK